MRQPCCEQEQHAQSHLPLLHNTEQIWFENNSSRNIYAAKQFSSLVYCQILILQLSVVLSLGIPLGLD